MLRLYIRSFQGLKQKCEKLLQQNEEEVVIYSLGAAIQRAIILALQLSDSYLSYKIATNTLTTELIGANECQIYEFIICIILLCR